MRMQTSAEMTPAAWAMGARNAGITTLAILVVMGILTALITLTTKQSIASSSRYMVVALLGIAQIAFYYDQIRGWQMKGQVEFDCGARPNRWLHILVTILIVPQIFAGAWDWLTGDDPVIRIVVALSVAAFYLMMAFGRLMVCTNGIWGYNTLIRWEKIKAYHWEEHTLIFETHTRFPLFGKGAVPFPPECKPSIEAFLYENVDRPRAGDRDES